jgi:hypothetical protein
MNIFGRPYVKKCLKTLRHMDSYGIGWPGVLAAFVMYAAVRDFLTDVRFTLKSGPGALRTNVRTPQLAGE